MGKRIHILRLIKIFSLILCVFFFCTLFLACTPKKYGDFYSLSDAYEKGYIDVEILQSIAYYYSGYTPYDGFKPIVKNPQGLNQGYEKAIRSSYANDLKTGYIKRFDEGVAVYDYYGMYGKCIVILLSGYVPADSDEISEETVAGINFKYENNKQIYVWRPNRG